MQKRADSEYKQQEASNGKVNFQHVKLGYKKSESPFSYLRLDVDLFGGVFVEPAHVNLTIKVSDVTDDGVILHVLEVTGGDKQLLTCNLLLCNYIRIP